MLSEQAGCRRSRAWTRCSSVAVARGFSILLCVYWRCLRVHLPNPHCLGLEVCGRYAQTLPDSFDSVSGTACPLLQRKMGSGREKRGRLIKHLKRSPSHGAGCEQLKHSKDKQSVVESAIYSDAAVAAQMVVLGQGRGRRSKPDGGGRTDITTATGDGGGKKRRRRNGPVLLFDRLE